MYHTPPVPGARPLLCINGGLLFDHKLLWPALSPLAAGRQLWFYDQRGRGRTPPPPGIRAARIEHDGLDAAAIAQHLREVTGGPIDLLGHSWGGGIAMLAVAATHESASVSSSQLSDTISRLVLINAVGSHSEHWLPQLTERALARLDGPAAERLRAAAASTKGSESLVGLPTKDSDPLVAAEYSQAIYPAWFASRALAALFTPPRATSRTGAIISARLRRDGYDWRPRLTGLGNTVPTLLLHGDADLIPGAVANETALMLGSLARVVHVPEAGHNPFWEQPSIVFSEIERFLDAR